jgi:hypothetical protein
MEEVMNNRNRTETELTKLTKVRKVSKGGKDVKHRAK